MPNQSISPCLLPSILLFSCIRTLKRNDKHCQSHCAGSKLLRHTSQCHPLLSHQQNDSSHHQQWFMLYLSVLKPHSRVGGHHHLSSCSHDPFKAPTTSPPPNGPIHTVCHKLCHAMLVSTEPDHPQPPTLIKTDNSTALGIANNSWELPTTPSNNANPTWWTFLFIEPTITSDTINSLSTGYLELKTLANTYFTKHHQASHHRLIGGSIYVPAPGFSKYAHGHSPSVL